MGEPIEPVPPRTKTCTLLPPSFQLLVGVGLGYVTEATQCWMPHCSGNVKIISNENDLKKFLLN
jgi:hypothetical protein